MNCKCYRLVTTELTWDDARSNCQAYYVESPDEGYDLASVTTPEENAYIATLVTALTWHGLTDMVVEGDFQFNDGTPYNDAYVKTYGWATGQPDDFGSVNISV